MHMFQLSDVASSRVLKDSSHSWFSHHYECVGTGNRVTYVTKSLFFRCPISDILTLLMCRAPHYAVNCLV
jgi:hypothetical protein